MATIVLSAVGMAAGGALGGSVLGLSTAVIGRAAGAALGRAIDQRLMGAGSAPVETGRIDRFRLTGASEGAPVAQVFGRMRVAGQVIWASRFLETTQSSGGGKGAPRAPATTSYSYSVSLAIALCEGEISRVGRVWADGVEVAPDDLNMRVYPGTEDQLPDPRIEAVEGAGAVPAYRGIAYVVFEDLPLATFGNRVPQFSFEVMRPSQPGLPADQADIARLIHGVALVPGTGEYTLATTPVYRKTGLGQTQAVNINTPSGKADLPTSLDALEGEIPALSSVSVVVGWFGDDLRCGQCQVQPKVEWHGADPAAMPWTVSGVGRAGAALVPQLDGRPVYGGTPADRAVTEALADLAARGKQAMFYPFLLMDQLAGNTLPDPASGQAGQPALPWRGRITTALAAGMAGTTDGTAAAEAEVAAFFGQAQPGDFTPQGGTVAYHGPAEWSYRRFILHYAHLCAAAGGGVSAFCIGSEMKALTQIRGAAGSFPAVAALVQLAADVRAVLGPDCKIGYAADWSEYAGYQPPGTGDKLFHLDPLWADPQIDFVGIDNYMPLSDWREGEDHADAHWGAIYNLDYLRSNVAGGEGFDWYYHSPEARAAQIRTPISDYWGEDWVWRVKDLQGWWANLHRDRIAGARAETPSAWQPRSKPIWFTELGCAAIDKATNQPNRFVDPKSSESGLPYGSNGQRDDLIQMQYLRAVHAHFADPVNNAVSQVYGGPMVDMSRAHVWAWDARPYPAFPANTALWSDGANYARGHWLNGRASARSLDGVVREICARAGLAAVETSALYGLVRGYGVDAVDSARAALQPLMLALGFDGLDREGALAFRSRSGVPAQPVEAARVLAPVGEAPAIEITRAPAAETAGRVRLGYVEADGDYETRAAEAAMADDATIGVTRSELALVLTQAEGQAIAERWLAEARVARDSAHFALPPSALALGAGDLVDLPLGHGTGRFRIDRVEQAEAQTIEAVRIDPEVYLPHEGAAVAVPQRPFQPPVPVLGQFMDLPLLRGDEDPLAPHFAVTGVPWPGTVALYSAAQDSGYALNMTLSRAAVLGETLSPLYPAPAGLWDRGPALQVRLVRGTLDTAGTDGVLAGANLAAIGDGSVGGWEVFQFAEASLVAPDTYALRLRLRGQAGTDATRPDVWPAGARLVLLDAGVPQIDLPANARGVTRYFRYGPAGRPLDDPSYTAFAAAFAGVGLRPLSVSHLRTEDRGGDLALGWIRRTRIDGDNWDGLDVPLGEDTELYQVRVIANGVVQREDFVTAPGWTYTAAMRAADGVAAPYRVEVAQVSARFGPGPTVGRIITA